MVMAGLVPATPLNKAPHRHTCAFLGSATVIGVAGTSPAMTTVRDDNCESIDAGAIQSNA
jgi:hypothetical protein